MNELISILNEASKAYYAEDREIMSNYEYDKLYDEKPRRGHYGGKLRRGDNENKIRLIRHGYARCAHIGGVLSAERIF